MLLLANYSKGGTHVVAPRVKSFFADFKCAWKGRAPSSSHLLSPTKISKNPIKTWKENHEKKRFFGTTKGIKKQVH
jgi:hypothetical protein